MHSPKLFVAAPAFGQQIHSECTASLVDVTHALVAKGMWGGFGTLSFPDIADLRNMFLTMWYDKIDATHILFVDSDMKCEAQLVLDMIEFNKPIVGCLYPKRTLPISFVGKPLPGDFIAADGFMQMEAIGFGITLISRNCIDELLSVNPQLSNSELDHHAAGDMMKGLGINRLIRAFDKTGSMSEDFSFCKRWRDCGGEVWANLSHRVTHLGWYGFAAAFGNGDVAWQEKLESIIREKKPEFFVDARTA